MPQQKIGVEDLTELFNPSGECVKRSAEVRWFVEGPLPARVSAWFAALGPGRREPHRTDVYLVTPDPSLNVKQRQGRLEIKRRDTEEGAVHFTEKTAGRVERWEKWILPTPPDLEAALENNAFEQQGKSHRVTGSSGIRAAGSDAPPPRVSPSPYLRVRSMGVDSRITSPDLLGWVRVGKARHLQSFAVNDEVRPIPVYTDKERGCNVELTRLTVGGERWWTLCFEAFGPGEELTDLLTRTVVHVFAESAPGELTAEHSYGYAQWLMHRIASMG